jgi:hypothetical protein
MSLDPGYQFYSQLPCKIFNCEVSYLAHFILISIKWDEVSEERDSLLRSM